MKIYVESKDIVFLEVNKRGRVINTGEPLTEKGAKSDTFESTYIDLSTVKVGSKLKLSFNKVQNQKLGLEPVYSELNYITTKIEQ